MIDRWIDALSSNSSVFLKKKKMKKIIAENKINDALANKTLEKKAVAIQLFNEERKKKVHGKEFVIKP